MRERDVLFWEAGEDVGGGGSGPISGVAILFIMHHRGCRATFRESVWKRWRDSIGADVSGRPECVFPDLVCLNVLVGVLRQLHT